MNVLIFNEAKKIWGDIARDVKLGALELEVEVHKKILNIFQVGDFYYFIFNVKDAEFEFISPEITTILGYDPENITTNTFLNNIHPEDQPYFLNFENSLHKFFLQLPLDKMESYKVRYDFRIKNAAGNYIRILHQLVILQHDSTGSVLRSLGIHTDISHLKTSGKPVLSFIGLNGEPSYIDIEVSDLFSPAKEIFSKRQKQILKLLAEGKSSVDLAKILNVSKHTIDTHRKNMLKKTDTASTLDLIMKSVKEGWI